MNTKTKKIILFSSMCLALAILSTSLFIRQSRNEVTTSTPSKTFTVDAVRQADGKDGNPCYVILSNIVYEIKQGNKWKNGEHTTSNGEAYCGQDATEVITKSPHGKSIISLLTELGTIE